ncbi:MAG: type II toxin-antitoxin system RelE/ParE family toxin [Candidatus Methanoplasma sp.]|nr:type II toxin-antitoxin system RelE/ParE family toxin [Candidatus Methanoplasma sp.]
MTFSVALLPSAKKQLDKLDKKPKEAISKWIDENLASCDNPRRRGKPLSGNLKGLWSYREGSFRVIVDIKDEELLVLVIKVCHRSRSYD